MNEQKIKYVYRFNNGMCMVFDKDGKQIPEYQGVWDEMKSKIVKDLPDDATISESQPYRRG